jgi:hypothetical protein
MVLAKHRGSHGCAQGDGERLTKNRRSSGVSAWVGTPSASKTGHTSDHRLYCAFFAKTECSGSISECLCGISRADRGGTASWPECYGHLARPGLGPRFYRWL